MADWLKIALKTGLVAVIMVALWAVFSSISIPSFDFSLLVQGLGVFLAVAYHYVPALQVVLPFIFAVFGVLIGVYIFKYSMIAIKWLFKVNE